MIKNITFIKICISILVVVVGSFLRLYKFENQVFFDWDQNRDYQVISNIAQGNITLIGPVAKGDGGFFLGPLYYYLVLPAYLLKSGDPLSLPIASIIIDISMIVSIAYLLSRRVGWRRAIIMSLIWSMSWFLIGWSRVSWNVALIPIWSLTTMVTLYDCIKYHRNQNLFILGLLAGLSWHIHASLIPIIPILIAIFFRRLSFDWKTWILSFSISLVPLLPLMIFDLRHNLLNIHLIQNYFVSNTMTSTTPILEIVHDVILKLGKNAIGIFTGEFKSIFWVGYAILFVSFWALLKKELMAKIAATLIIAVTILCIFLRDIKFPEYYLSLSYFPIVYLVSDLLISIFKNMRYVLYILIGIFLYTNIRLYSTNPGGYGYIHKIAIVKGIAKLGKPVNIRYELSSGREGGLLYLLARNNVVIEEGSSTKIVITDKVDGPVKMGQLDMSDLVKSGNFKASIVELE